MNVDGAAPFLMTSATTGAPTVCGVSPPTLNAATPGHTQVTLEWSTAAGADYVEVNLYYQTTSREYIEFLRDEINGTGNLTLRSPTPSGEQNAYIIQTEPFFAQLSAWGDTIWKLWTHNMNVDGAAPFLMTSATTSIAPSCGVAAPALDPATAAHSEVTLAWSAGAGATGYKVYYDQAGKAQFVADAGNTLSYLDTGLTNGQEYCYKVTSYDATCESGYSNIVCATPQTQGQAGPAVGVAAMEAGYWSGKGRNLVWTPSPIPVGETVTIRAQVLDQATLLPIANATVEIVIGGPETVTLNSNPSDAEGWAEVKWQTQTPNRKGQGGTAPGTYTASTKNVTASGYTWDSVTTSIPFVLQ
jgi:hypothetical protein